jgi:hypothetical protein
MYWADIAPPRIGRTAARVQAGGCDDAGVRALAAVFALVAVGCMVLAIVGMVTGRPSDRAGFLIRALAVLCFAVTVILTVSAH